MLHFYGAARQGPCAGRATLAVTCPGCRTIGLCARFGPELRYQADAAEIALIHATLHTLGLGENPAPYDQITRRIRSRCR